MAKARQPPIVAYLTVKGGLDAISFYERAFDAELYNSKIDDDGKRVVHAVLGMFGTMIMLSDEFPEYSPEMKAPTALRGTTVTLHVGFDKAAKVDAAIKKASNAGCKVTAPAEDAFWGMRYGRVLDPFGHAWAFGAPLTAKRKG